MKENKSFHPKKTFFLLIILLGLHRPAFAAPAFVSHVSFNFEDGSVTFYLGAEAGIKPGDIFEVVRDGVTVARIEAVEVEPLYTRAKILGADKYAGGAAMIGEIPEPPAEQPAQKKTAPEKTAAPSQPEPQPEKQETAPTTPPPSSAPPDKETKEQQNAPREQDLNQQQTGEKTSPEDIIVLDEDLREKMQKKEIDIDLSGYRYMIFRTYSSSGNEQNFLSFNGLLTRGGRIEQGTDLKVKMTYGETTTLEGSIYEIPDQERELRFELNSGHYKALFGEFQADFRSGSLASISKKISGAEVQYTTKKIEADWFMSESKSNSKTVSFTGDNTHGPFALDAFQMVENSETVKVNGQLIPQSKYDIDYYSGQITFCDPVNETECMVIKSTDTVQVTYEEKLLLSLSGGTINGVSAKYNFSEDQSLGVAYLSQEASSANQRIRAAGSFPVPGEPPLTLATSVIQLPITGTDYPQYLFLVQESRYITVKKNGQPLTFNVDYIMDNANYLRGRIPLNVDFTATDTFQVNYTYYIQDYVGEVRDEKLFRTGAEIEFYLTGSRTGVIYPGSEAEFGVFLCDSDPCIKIEPLTPDEDYMVMEGNRIKVINSAYLPDMEDEYILISYLTVPFSGALTSDYNHTVAQIFGNTKIGSVDIGFEFGESESDISSTPVQVMSEKVAQATGTVTCPTQQTPPDGCRYILRNDNIADSSEKIRFSSSDRTYINGIDYTLDYDTAELIFKGNLQIATDTVIYADYRYNPDIQTGLQKGRATRFTAATNIKKYGFSLRSSKTDPFFAPLSGNTSLETSRLDLALSGKPTDSLNFDISTSNFDIARDIAESSVLENNQLNAKLSYKRGKQTYAWSYGKDTSRDNLPIPALDQARTKNSLSVSASELWKPGLNLSYTASKENFNDNAGTVNDTSSASSELGLEYKQGDKLNVKAVFNNSNINTSGITPYSSRAQSRNIKLSYNPWELVTVSADIDRQRTADSRPGQGASGKDSSGLSIVALGVGDFQSIAFNLTQQSYPSFTSGDSQSETSSLNCAYSLTSSLTFSPGISKTRSSAVNYASDSTRKTLKLDYRPQKARYELSTTKEFSDTTTSSASGAASSSSGDTLSLDFKYKFGEKMDFLYRYNRTQQDSADSSETTLNQSWRLGYNPGKKEKYGITYTISDRSQAGTVSKKNLLLESDISLSKILRWKTEFTSMKYSDPGKADENFNGNFLKSELRAEF